MLEFFPQSERDFIRSSLGNTILAICAQRLLPAVKDFEVKVVPACELLFSTSVVREMIREGHDSDIPTIINQGQSDGMRSFTMSLAELVEKDWVDIQVARNAAPNREALDSMLKGVEVKADTLVGRRG